MCSTPGFSSTFALTAVAVGVLTGFHHRLFGDAIDVFTAATIAFGEFEDFFVTGVCDDTTFYARHEFLLSVVQA